MNNFFVLSKVTTIDVPYSSSRAAIRFLVDSICMSISPPFDDSAYVLFFKKISTHLLAIVTAKITYSNTPRLCRALIELLRNVSPLYVCTLI